MPNYAMNYLPEDPVKAEQMLYDMLDDATSLATWTRRKWAKVTSDPGALGHSPEVTSMLRLSDAAGVIWNVRSDCAIFVSY